MSPPLQISSDNLLKSINNLINLCENASSDSSRHRDKLNSILNDLNSIEFKYVQSVDIYKVFYLCICYLIINYFTENEYFLEILANGRCCKSVKLYTIG